MAAAASAAFSIDTIDFQLGPGKEFNFKERGPVERKKRRKEGRNWLLSLDGSTLSSVRGSSILCEPLFPVKSLLSNATRFDCEDLL